TSLSCTKRMYPMHYPFPPQDVVEFFFTYYGPTVRALAALDPDKQRTLREELVQLWAQNNRATDGTSTHIESEYLEVDGVRA
ncbi:MAG TPA: SAM-dependent methyltransferase, partial [Noviherbaspirillum sp.]|nr:SAM-dependent methyltransferase [Noviherbaspirillum sp.]